MHDAPDTGGRQFAPTLFVRNAHPKQIVYLPLGLGWCRILRPAVTTRVPEQLLHTPVVRQLLLRKLIDVVDGAAWDADARQRRASRIDMTRAIAAAEQREFDQLLRQRSQTKDTRSWTRLTPELEARLLADGADLAALHARHRRELAALLEAGVADAAIARATGVSPALVSRIRHGTRRLWPIERGVPEVADIQKDDDGE